MSTFTIHTVESAPAEVKEVLETVQKDNNGYIPNLIGLLANAPTALETYRTVELDEERKAAMVSNLLVVLCGNHDAQPIVNTGSLY